MPEKSPEFEFHLEAETELKQKQLLRADPALRELASGLAAAVPLYGQVGTVYREHVLRAAELLFDLAAEIAARLESDGAPQVFLSYSSQDQDFVNELHADLEQAGLNCFVADHSIPAGKEWAERLFHALRVCRVAVFVLTPDAIKSDWCKAEAGAAVALKKVVVPVLRHLDKSRIPDVLKSVRKK